MAHASDSNRGILHYSSNFGSYLSPHNGLLKSEWRTVYKENLIRMNAGIPVRTHYGINISGNGVMSPSGPSLVVPIKTVWKNIYTAKL